MFVFVKAFAQGGGGNSGGTPILGGGRNKRGLEGYARETRSLVTGQRVEKGLSRTTRTLGLPRGTRTRNLGK